MSPLYITTMLLNTKISYNVAKILFDEFVSFKNSVLPKENKLSDFFMTQRK